MKRPIENLFAVVAPGLEEVCAAELEALGASGVKVVAGGVEFEGDLSVIYRANLWLRSASRVLVRVGEVKSRDFPSLFRTAVRLPWGKFIKPGSPVQVRASTHSSRLNHTGRIAATVGDAIDRALGRKSAAGEGPEQLVLARFENDICRLSVDSSGELLHRRGYRVETAHAPLRETLAAGILLLLGWDGSTALLDPMCGSGTFLVEGALIAENRPPGMERDFAFMSWPRYRPGLWEALLQEARRQVRKAGVPIHGSDRDEVAVAASRRNAQRAGVADAVTLHLRELSRLAAPEGLGLVLCNPPYGERLSKGRDLRPLFASLGEVYRRACPGWRGAILCPDPRLGRATGLPLRSVASLVNGGIPVSLYEADL